MPSPRCRLSEIPSASLAKSSLAPLAPHSFVMCLSCLFVGMTVQQFQPVLAMYQHAYNLACEALRPYWLRPHQLWALN